MSDPAPISEEAVASLMAERCPESGFSGRRVLVIIPDGTRTAPVGMLFRALHRQLAPAVACLDVMVALGTHPPMTEEAIRRRLEISGEEREGPYRAVKFLNHQWDRPEALREIGTISGERIEELTGGLFAMDVPVEVNRHLFDYDRLIILGPVFPHEVAGFSGGNKYLFPGVSGPRLLNFFHWLGAMVTNPRTIGHKRTAVRRVIDHAAGMVEVPRQCFSMVVRHGGLGGLFEGTPERSWEEASELSRRWHIRHCPRPFHTILSCAPPMYGDLWVGGKCMYKLEPVLADDGELVIFAPHIREVSPTHGERILRLGYHCRDFFLERWDRYRSEPWGVLAHLTHVYGQGTCRDGVERPRARVTLATGLGPEVCRRLNLGWRDPESIRIGDFAGREEEGILHVPRAGEELFQLQDPPVWARPDSRT